MEKSNEPQMGTSLNNLQSHEPLPSTITPEPIAPKLNPNIINPTIPLIEEISVNTQAAIIAKNPSRSYTLKIIFLIIIIFILCGSIFFAYTQKLGIFKKEQAQTATPKTQIQTNTSNNQISSSPSSATPVDNHMTVNNFDLSIPNTFKIIINGNNIIAATQNGGVNATNGVAITVTLKPKGDFDKTLLSNQKYYSENKVKGTLTLEKSQAINGKNIREYRINGNNGFYNYVQVHNEVKIADNYYVATYKANLGTASVVSQENLSSYYNILGSIKNK